MSNHRPGQYGDVRLTITAFLGIAVISIVQLSATAIADNALRFSVYCFAAAIPLLAGYLRLLAFDPHRQHIRGRLWYVIVLAVCGPLATLLGLGGIFWHFSYRVALVFIVACVIALVIWNAYEFSVKRAARQL